MASYHGKNGVVYMSADGTGNAVPVLRQTEYTLSTSADTDDVTYFGNINKRYVQGIPDMTFSLSGIWDDTDDALWDNARSSDGVKVYLYPSSLVATKYFYGPSWVSFDEVSVGVGGAVRVSASGSANGDWGQY